MIAQNERFYKEIMVKKIKDLVRGPLLFERVVQIRCLLFF